jgi:cytoskeletal protein CcmA (bactofilin family)
VTGSIEVGPNARVDGGIHVHKDQSDGGGTIDEPRVVIGPGSVVKGTLKFERPVKLYVSDHATTGAVEGATVIAFTGDRPRGE